MYNVKYTIHGACYYAYIGDGAISILGQTAIEIVSGRSIALVADTNTASLYLQVLKTQLSSFGFNVIPCVIAAGESGKNLQTVESLYCNFYSNGVSRADGVVALGGGVVGDIAGYAAATYLRGLPFINIPTSLIAQVDSAYGGKTGVDYNMGKNYIGCFYQPSAVVCDTSFLGSLPKRELLSGMGEIIKYAAVADEGLLDSIINNGATIPNTDSIARCVEIKKRFCERDPLDTGVRRILNFGHTLGHAYEVASGYSLSHGQAVLLGMLAAAKFGVYCGITTPNTYNLLYNAAVAVGLDTDWETGLHDAVKLIGLDKKSDGNNIKMIFLKQIGVPVIQSIPVADIEVMAKHCLCKTLP